MNHLYAAMTLSVFSLCAHALDPGEESWEGAPSAHFDYLVYAVTWQPMAPANLDISRTL